MSSVARCGISDVVFSIGGDGICDNKMSSVDVCGTCDVLSIVSGCSVSDDVFSSMAKSLLS